MNMTNYDTTSIFEKIAQAGAVRLRRQKDGIKKAQAVGAYQGGGVDQEKHKRILDCLSKGMGIRETSRITASTATVQRALKLKAV